MPALALVGLCGIGAACSAVDDTGDADDTSVGDDTSAGDDTGSDSQDTDLPCLTIGAFSGQVLSPSGAPPTSRMISLCGSSCENFPGAIDESGAFAVQPTDCWYPVEPWPRPFFWLHGLETDASMFYDFVPEYDTGGSTHLDEVSIGATFYSPSVASMTTADVSAGTLDAGDGLTLTWSPSGVHFPLGHDDPRIGVARMDAAHWPPLPGVETLSALVAVYPDDTTFDPPASLTLPNAGLDPGTAVEILAIGNLTDPLGVPTGTLVVVGTGAVNGDGSAVQVNEGIEVLRWVGYRPSSR